MQEIEKIEIAIDEKLNVLFPKNTLTTDYIIPNLILSLMNEHRGRTWYIMGPTIEQMRYNIISKIRKFFMYSGKEFDEHYNKFELKFSNELGTIYFRDRNNENTLRGIRYSMIFTDVTDTYEIILKENF